MFCKAGVVVGSGRPSEDRRCPCMDGVRGEKTLSCVCDANEVLTLKNPSPPNPSLLLRQHHHQLYPPLLLLGHCGGPFYPNGLTLLSLSLVPRGEIICVCDRSQDKRYKTYIHPFIHFFSFSHSLVFSSAVFERGSSRINRRSPLYLSTREPGPSTASQTADQREKVLRDDIKHFSLSVMMILQKSNIRSCLWTRK